jgi:dephospho-CoA kinase
MTTLLPCLIMYFLGKKIQKVHIFGLTGGIASGKSTLVTMMKDSLGDVLHVIDCDLITRELSMKGNAGYKLILSMLGDSKEQYLVPSSQ